MGPKLQDILRKYGEQEEKSGLSWQQMRSVLLAENRMERRRRIPAFAAAGACIMIIAIAASIILFCSSGNRPVVVAEKPKPRHSTPAVNLEKGTVTDRKNDTTADKTVKSKVDVARSQPVPETYQRWLIKNTPPKKNRHHGQVRTAENTGTLVSRQDPVHDTVSIEDTKPAVNDPEIPVPPTIPGPVTLAAVAVEEHVIDVVGIEPESDDTAFCVIEHIEPSEDIEGMRL